MAMQGNHTVTTPPFRHRSSHSTDLDVFDATQYFSGGMDGVGFSCTSSRIPSYRPTMMRRSLEVPTMAVLPCQEPAKVSESPIREEKKCKQPISPGSRLASFLNSFFQQTLYKKEEKKKSRCLKDDGDAKVINGGRRRRGSIRNPESFSCASKISSPNQKLANKGTEPDHALWKQRAERFSETGNEGKFSGIGFEERKWVLRRNNGDGLMLRARKEEGLREKGKGLLCMKEEEEKLQRNGNDSDSSSDLFELKSYDMGDLSCELPVYGTTDAGLVIRR